MTAADVDRLEAERLRPVPQPAVRDLLDELIGLLASLYQPAGGKP